MRQMEPIDLWPVLQQESWARLYGVTIVKKINKGFILKFLVALNSVLYITT
jgi:hypothetical protein